MVSLSISSFIMVFILIVYSEKVLDLVFTLTELDMWKHPELLLHFVQF
jgi:hypothetical protein